jgi:thioredoxin-related protein
LKKLILSLLLLATVTVRAELTWLSDLEEAKKVAKAEKKVILLLFTGSDWCGPCISLKKEVFDQKKFAAVTNDFVLVELDYPRKTEQSAQLKAKNSGLYWTFGIDAFPTIMLLDAEGAPFARKVGYQEGGPVKYLAQLKGLRKANTPEGRMAFAKTIDENADEVAVEAYTEEFLLNIRGLELDEAALEAAVAKFIQEKGVTGCTKFLLTVKLFACSIGPVRTSELLKALDKIIAATPSPSEKIGYYKGHIEHLRRTRAEVAAKVAAKAKK